MAGIKFDHVDKYFGNVHILKDLNIAVGRDFPEDEKGRARVVRGEELEQTIRGGHDAALPPPLGPAQKAINLLGELEVHDGKRLIPIRVPRHRTVLAALALAGGRPVRRGIGHAATLRPVTDTPASENPGQESAGVAVGVI